MHLPCITFIARLVITSTHILLSLAVLSKASERKRNLSIVSGSLIPDLAIFLWAPYQALVNGVSGAQMWEELYFQAPMQDLIAWFNSIPIYAALLFIGFFARSKSWGTLLVVFALAALIHISLDLPVHADDAYRHFWPLSDWRFYSPFSYWDIDHHAAWVGKIDIGIALLCVAILWRRFWTRWVKIILGGVAIFYSLILVAPLLFG